MWLEASREPPPGWASCGTCRVVVSLASGLFPLSAHGTVPACPSLCFETLDPSLYSMEKWAHEGFLRHPATEVESNHFHSNSLTLPSELRFAVLLTETRLAVCSLGLLVNKGFDDLNKRSSKTRRGRAGANCCLWLRPFSYPSML